MSTSKNEVPAGARNYCLRESCDQTDTWILKLCDARDCGLTDYVFGNCSARTEKIVLTFFVGFYQNFFVFIFF